MEIDSRSTHCFLRACCGSSRTTHGRFLVVGILVITGLDVLVVSACATGATTVVFGVTVVPTRCLRAVTVSETATSSAYTYLVLLVILLFEGSLVSLIQVLWFFFELLSRLILLDRSKEHGPFAWPRLFRGWTGFRR